MELFTSRKVTTKIGLTINFGCQLQGIAIWKGYVCPSGAMCITGPHYEVRLRFPNVLDVINVSSTYVTIERVGPVILFLQLQDNNTLAYLCERIKL